MKNGVSGNLHDQSNSVHFAYERLPPARLVLNNDQPLSHDGTQAKTAEKNKYLLCYFVDSKWVPLTYKAVTPTYQNSKHLYQGKLFFSSIKQWSIVTFDENDDQQKDKKRLTPVVSHNR